MIPGPVEHETGEAGEIPANERMNVALIRITRRLDDTILYETEEEDLRAAVVKAVSSGADLSGADLSGANLYGADLPRARAWRGGAGLMRVTLRVPNDPLPVWACGLITGLCFGAIAGMVGLRILEQWWK